MVSVNKYYAKKVLEKNTASCATVSTESYDVLVEVDLVAIACLEQSLVLYVRFQETSFHLVHCFHGEYKQHKTRISF